MLCKHTENEFDSNWNLLRKFTTVKRGIVETYTQRMAGCNLSTS